MLLKSEHERVAVLLSLSSLCFLPLLKGLSYVSAVGHRDAPAQECV